MTDNDNMRKIDELLKSPFTCYYVYEAKKRRDIKNRERNNEMKELYRNGMSFADIGRKYGISRQRVFQIVKGRKI